MKIIKRNGMEAEFDKTKIERAISKANLAGTGQPELSDEVIHDIACTIEEACAQMRRALSVEEIQEMVETQLMSHQAFEVAKRYIRYRYTSSLVRKANTTDNKILTRIECNKEEAEQEILNDFLS